MAPNSFAYTVLDLESPLFCFFEGGIAAYELISHPQHTCSSLRGHVTYTVKAGVFLVSVAILIGMCEAQYAIKILLKCVFVTLLNVSGNISHFDG